MLDSRVSKWAEFLVSVVIGCDIAMMLRSHRLQLAVAIYYPIGSMYAIYGNIYHQYTPNVSIYTSTMDPMGIGDIWGYQSNGKSPVPLQARLQSYWFCRCSALPISDCWTATAWNRKISEPTPGKIHVTLDWKSLLGIPFELRGFDGSYSAEGTTDWNVYV